MRGHRWPPDLAAEDQEPDVFAERRARVVFERAV